MSSKGINRRDFLKMSSLAGTAALLAACAPATPPPAAPTQASAVLPTTAPPPAQKVVITLWGWWDIRMKIFDDAGKDLTVKDSNFEMKTEVFAFEDLFTKVYAAVPAGTGPTLLKQKVGEYFKMIDKEMLMSYPEDRFTDAWLKEKYPYFNWTAYGRYVVPSGGMGAMLIYNKKMFTEAGLDPENPPTTLDELMVAAQKLAKRDSGGNLTLAGYENGTEFPALDFLYQQGGNLVKRAGDKLASTFNTPEMEKAYQFLTELSTKYKVWEPGYLEWVEALGTQKTAMGIGEAFALGDILGNHPDVYPNLALAAPPTFTGKVDPYYGRKSEVLMLSVMKNRPDAEYTEAWKYLEYILKDRIDVLYKKIEILNLAPDRLELFDYPQVKSSAILPKLIPVLPKEFDPVQTPDELQKLLDDVRDRIVLNGSTIKDALAYGDTEWQKILDGGLANHIV
jgi:ABC-type glycerol-3-phosphate transport system substrate-binding protein